MPRSPNGHELVAAISTGGGTFKSLLVLPLDAARSGKNVTRAHGVRVGPAATQSGERVKLRQSTSATRRKMMPNKRFLLRSSVPTPLAIELGNRIQSWR